MPYEHFVSLFAHCPYNEKITNSLVAYHFHLVVSKIYCCTCMGFLLDYMFKLADVMYQNHNKRTGNFMHVLLLALGVSDVILSDFYSFGYQW
jgi:heme/copper-type cytochrome/quinol oxidase subunit 1